jgi:hypothetical protein
MFRNILALLILPLISYAQYKSDFKDGVYYSIQELNDNTPCYDSMVEISTYIKKDTFDGLGSRYKIKISGEVVTNLNIFCIVKDSAIYFNNRRFDRAVPGFKKALIKSKNFYRFIYSGYNIHNYVPLIVGAGIFGGLIGAAIAGSAIYTVKDLDGSYYRQPGLVDIHTGKFISLTEKGMVDFLFQDHHDLYEKYRALENRNDVGKLYEIVDEYEQRLN